jgi:ABC-2 type transport system ATP-binding protein
VAQAIEVERLRKVFSLPVRQPGVGGALRSLVRPARRERVAVDGVSFSIAPGELVAFIGPNGAGKSTTIKMLTGILYPTSGAATVLGLTPWQDRSKLAYGIASVFGQKSQLSFHLPPRDSFDLLASIYDLERRAYRHRLAELTNAFDLGPLLDQPVRKMSLGERMRCEVAGSLLHRPRVLFLDEPTIGLDVVARQTMRDLILRLNAEEGVTVLLTSHDAGDVEYVCRRAIVINSGAIIFDDSIGRLRRDFLGHKVIDVTLAQPAPELQVPGATCIERSDYHLTVEVDTARQPLDAVVASILSGVSVADIQIGEPPLEEVIAAIYRGTSR